jgi:hypothetical protein
MTGRVGSLAIIALTLALAPQSAAHAAPPPRQVSIRVDSVLAADTHEGVDPHLAMLSRKLQGLFSYSTYSLVSHQDGITECGKMIAFELPGGKILHIQPRAVDGDMIAMEIVLFDGTRPMMTTDLKLKDNGTLIVGGPRYEQGMLIISIGASTGAHPVQGNQIGIPAEATTR